LFEFTDFSVFEVAGRSDQVFAAAQQAVTVQPHSEPLVLSPALHPTAPALVSGSDIPIAPLPTGGTLSMLNNAGDVRPLEEMEHEIIRFAISHYRGQMSEVARRLKIGRSTLYRKLDETSTEDPTGGGTEQTS